MNWLLYIYDLTKKNTQEKSKDMLVFSYVKMYEKGVKVHGKVWESVLRATSDSKCNNKHGMCPRL